MCICRNSIPRLNLSKERRDKEQRDKEQRDKVGNHYFRAAGRAIGITALILYPPTTLGAYLAVGEAAADLGESLQHARRRINKTYVCNIAKTRLEYNSWPLRIFGHNTFFTSLWNWRTAGSNTSSAALPQGIFRAETTMDCSSRGNTRDGSHLDCELRSCPLQGSTLMARHCSLCCTGIFATYFRTLSNDLR